MTFRLDFAVARIPFRTAFGHAAATRRTGAAVLVRAEDEAGHVGLGEACPRDYVTGETLDSACAFLARHRAALTALDSPDALAAWRAANADDAAANPSAAGAADIALTDLFARWTGRSIEAFLGVPETPETLTATAVYGAGSGLKFALRAVLFARAGITACKLKLTGAGADIARAKRLARRGPVRLDANNLWPDAEAALPDLRALAEYAWAVEEPVAARDWAGMARIAEETGLTIIADESFTGAADLAAMPAGFIPNFRVSKLGGLIPALELLRTARDEGRRVVVGAHVGETSILARAGAALAHAAGDALTGYEGGYGTHLLAWDAASPEVKIARGGAVRTPPGPGLGLTLTERAATLDWR